jgi:hypothetical protein
VTRLPPLTGISSRDSQEQNRNECKRRGHVTHPPRDPQKVSVAKTGRVNYTTMEDISEGEPVLMGMFFLNDHSAIVLFDSGATHDFVSKACT